MGIAMARHSIAMLALIATMGVAMAASPHSLSADVEPSHAQAFFSEMEEGVDHLSAEDKAEAEAFQAGQNVQKMADKEVKDAMKSVQNVHAYVAKKEFDLNGGTTQDEAHKVYTHIKKNMAKKAEKFKEELDKKTTEYNSKGQKVSGRLSPEILGHN